MITPGYDLSTEDSRDPVLSFLVLLDTNLTGVTETEKSKLSQSGMSG